MFAESSAKFASHVDHPTTCRFFSQIQAPFAPVNLPFRALDHQNLRICTLYN